MAAKRQEENLSKPIPAPPTEDPTAANTDVKLQPIELRRRRGRKRRERNPNKNSDTKPDVELKDNRPYNLRKRAKIDYKEKDRHQINQIEITNKNDETSPTAKEEMRPKSCV